MDWYISLATMPKDLATKQDTSTIRIDRCVLTRMKTLAFWQERTIKDVMQEACNTYLHQQASASLKKHLKKQGKAYGQVMLEQALESYIA